MERKHFCFFVSFKTYKWGRFDGGKATLVLVIVGLAAPVRGGSQPPTVEAVVPAVLLLLQETHTHGKVRRSAGLPRLWQLVGGCRGVGASSDSKTNQVSQKYQHLSKTLRTVNKKKTQNNVSLLSECRPIPWFQGARVRMKPHFFLFQFSKPSESEWTLFADP